MKLIDKLKPISAISNVATVGYQTLFAVFTNGASGANNYTGTKAEADAIKNALVVKLAETASDDGYDADKQYLSVRTIAGTKQFPIITGSVNAIESGVIMFMSFKIFPQ